MDLREHLQRSVGSDYAIDRELAGGGMARVFLGHEAALDRAIVVKVLPPETAQELSVERFRREMQVAARLSHPNIVPILGTGNRNELLYYIMPYVAGESLRDRLDGERQLGLADALRIAREVAGALDYAHRNGVVH